MTAQQTIEKRVRAQIKQQAKEREDRTVGLIVAKLQASADLGLVDKAADKENFDRLTAYVTSTQEQIDDLASKGVVGEKAIAEVVQQIESTPQVPPLNIVS